MSTDLREATETLPERDWLAMAGGLLLVAVSFAGMAYAAYHGWALGDISTDWAYTGIGFGFVFVAMGAFIFSYGWERGDMAKAVRLTVFICVLALVAIVVVILLAKSKGGTAKGTAEVGAAAGKASSSGRFDVGPVLGAVGSMFSDEAEKKAAASAKEPKVRETLFQMTCRACGARFAPAPPEAQCPYCGESALKA